MLQLEERDACHWVLCLNRYFLLQQQPATFSGKKDKDSFYKDYGDIPGLRDQGHKTETFLFGLCFQEREGETSVKPATDGRT